MIFFLGKRWVYSSGADFSSSGLAGDLLGAKEEEEEEELGVATIGAGAEGSVQLLLVVSQFSAWLQPGEYGISHKKCF